MDPDMATKKKTQTTTTVDETLTEQLGLRVTPSERARIDALAERFPLVGRSNIVRTAVMLGLDAIDAQPGILIGERPKR